MRPGVDQLTYSCFDFYSIQHWLTASGKTHSVQFVPIEAPLVVLSDLNTYKWADHLEFDKAHVYSLTMNNYWYTNFCAYQSGRLSFRYRLTSSSAGIDGVTATQFAWQPFHPLQPVWLDEAPASTTTGVEPFVRLAGDPVIVSCVKRAESGNAVILRLLEMRGKPATCQVALNTPASARITAAHVVTAIEAKRETLPMSDKGVEVNLRANEIVTVRLDVKR
jgi:alpha-mannosidase